MKNSANATIKKTEWLFKEKSGLQLLFSPLLLEEKNLIHAFTTRHGGESQHPYDSFNLGRNVDTDAAKADAIRNRKRLCTVFELDFDRLVVPGQVHSNNVVWSKGEKKDQSAPPIHKEVDGIVTNEIRVPVLLHFADCVPIILFDTKNKTLSVVHAGWRGTAAKIVKNAVAELTRNGESKAENIIAAIGPAIGTCCYQTGKDVAEQLAQTVSDCDDLILWKNEHPYPDLQAINGRQLSESGVSRIDISNLCTACHPELFYSHRQSGGKTGRQGALASLA